METIIPAEAVRDGLHRSGGGMGSLVRKDLLKVRSMARLVRARWFPLAFQLLILAAILAVAAAGVGLGRQMNSSELAVFRKTNLTTLLVWGLWWPAMVVVMVLAGRVWCTVCPLELVDRAGDWLGRRLGLRRLRVGPVLLAGWGMLSVYLAFHILVAAADLHRVPYLTALVVFALVVAAFLAGLSFRHPRAFCTTFCPAGVMLSTYARFTPLQLEVRDPDTCSACETKDCIRESNRFRLDARSCPSLLRPYARKASDGCTLCFQCAKVCPHDNVGFGLVAPEAPIRRKIFLTGPETLFLLVVTGFLVSETTEDVSWLNRGVESLLGRLETFLSLGEGWAELLVFLVVLPLVLWALVALVARALGARSGTTRLLVAAATAAAPVVAAVHAVKGLAKILEWGPYLPLAIHDPRGLDSLTAIRTGQLPAPHALVGLGPVGWLGLPVLAAVSWWSWRQVGAWETWDRQVGRVAVAVVAVVFGGILASWVVGGS